MLRMDVRLLEKPLPERALAHEEAEHGIIEGKKRSCPAAGM